jgi:hypothetical protein
LKVLGSYNTSSTGEDSVQSHLHRMLITPVRDRCLAKVARSTSALENNLCNASPRRVVRRRWAYARRQRSSSAIGRAAHSHKHPPSCGSRRGRRYSRAWPCPPLAAPSGGPAPRVDPGKTSRRFWCKTSIGYQLWEAWEAFPTLCGSHFQLLTLFASETRRLAPAVRLVGDVHFKEKSVIKCFRQNVFQARQVTPSSTRRLGDVPVGVA